MLRGSVDGQELAQQLRVVRPETKALFVSGYSETMITAGAASCDSLQFLQKPFSTQALRGKIREVLASSPQISASQRVS